MRNSASLLICLLGAAALGGSSCDDESGCTEIGCFNRFALYIRPSESDSSARFAAGTYRFDATVDGETIGCNFAIPADRTAHYECTGREILAGTDQILVTFPGTPETIEVTLSAGAAEVLSDTYAPIYEASTPNGPDCPPLCRGASATAFVEP